ncbi:hypothetical protein I6H88_12350 [Elizabethkingia bruuniana]|uniref:Uncharacterized protein n=1 Tax=Elizabethkingia bruuniana TaxID=1756149 RepID=A0A7T7UVZ6_9FLAO|nr:hypothetical protein [Elizabethkingia bruuniana]KGO08811.1 hypothetical protein KS04_19875 [Elizabethkingia miricola]AQX83835.1 hypothetical protein AYC65_01825 [Elizabethkingia bruuniana]KUY28087.1 hypothetical protein ATB97_14210 [Elizabethkingia bruuniana]OPB64256.1 hypothetical protein BAY12_05465 [Elizabethkingia bruuniana]QDZ63443.1 hypothetical protein EVD20_13660 [Elizabethkingia bruuniana]
MENKNSAVNTLIKKLRNENNINYTIVDFWDADITAIGLKFENVLFYISTFNYNNINQYNLILEDCDTGEIIETEKIVSYENLIKKMKDYNDKSDAY